MKPVEPVAEVPAQPSSPPPEAKPVEPVAEAARPEPPTAKAPDISIYEAAKKGNIEAVKQHLVAGADVNAGGVFGTTPLHHAVKERRTETVKLLISKNADVNVMAQGKTPLDMPRSAGLVKETEAISKFLRKHGGKTADELGDWKFNPETGKATRGGRPVN